MPVPFIKEQKLSQMSSPLPPPQTFPYISLLRTGSVATWSYKGGRERETLAKGQRTTGKARFISLGLALCCSEQH